MEYERIIWCRFSVKCVGVDHLIFNLPVKSYHIFIVLVVDSLIFNEVISTNMIVNIYLLLENLCTYLLRNQ